MDKAKIYGIRPSLKYLPCLQISGVFGNALEAKKQLQRQKIDLIFHDINMPVHVNRDNAVFRLGETLACDPIYKGPSLFVVYVAVTERINSNDVKPYTTFYPTYQIGDSVYKNVSITNRMNIGVEYNTGFIVTGSLPLAKSLNIRENLMLFNLHVVNNLNSGNKTDGLNWRLNINASYQFPKAVVAEAFGGYRSSFNSIQGRQ